MDIYHPFSTTEQQAEAPVANISFVDLDDLQTEAPVKKDEIESSKSLRKIAFEALWSTQEQKKKDTINAKFMRKVEENTQNELAPFGGDLLDFDMMAAPARTAITQAAPAAAPETDFFGEETQVVDHTVNNLRLQLVNNELDNL